MPYTKEESRSPFKEPIDIIVEYLGWNTPNNPSNMKLCQDLIYAELRDKGKHEDIEYLFGNFMKVLDKDRSVDLAKGDLNFVVSSIIWKTIQKLGIRYHNLNDFVGGVLSMCQDELQRRITSSYENEARDKNGEVFK